MEDKNLDQLGKEAHELFNMLIEKGYNKGEIAAIFHLALDFYHFQMSVGHILDLTSNFKELIEIAKGERKG